MPEGTKRARQLYTFSLSRAGKPSADTLEVSQPGPKQHNVSKVSCICESHADDFLDEQKKKTGSGELSNTHAKKKTKTKH